MTTKTRLTADDLERMPDDDSAIVELDEGELITMPLASEDHGYFEGESSAVSFPSSTSTTWAAFTRAISASASMI
jgi:hypothetical protein